MYATYVLLIEFYKEHSYATHHATDLVDITSFIDTADDILFRQIFTDPNHVLAHLLPEKKLTRITDLDPGNTIIS